MNKKVIFAIVAGVIAALVILAVFLVIAFLKKSVVIQPESSSNARPVVYDNDRTDSSNNSEIEQTQAEVQSESSNDAASVGDVDSEVPSAPVSGSSSVIPPEYIASQPEIDYQEDIRGVYTDENGLVYDEYGSIIGGVVFGGPEGIS